LRVGGVRVKVRNSLLQPGQARDKGERFLRHEAIDFVAQENVDAAIPVRVCYCGRATARERGSDPAAKGDPLMAVSAPVVGSIAYPEILLEFAFAT
jgi:hypothetical protein